MTICDRVQLPPAPRNALTGYLFLYGSLYLAYGTESAYLPEFLRDHGLTLEQVGLTLAAGTVVRIVTGPLTGRLADYLGALKHVLVVAACLSGLIGFAYLFAYGFAPLLAVIVCHAAVTPLWRRCATRWRLRHRRVGACSNTAGCAGPVRSRSSSGLSFRA